MTAQYPAPPVNQTATPTFSVDPVTGAPLSPTDGQATNISQINGQTVNSSDGNMPVEQKDLTTSGTLSAAQPTEGTPVANATLVLSVGQGQSAWRASLVAGAGFTSATTIVADRTVDGTNWVAMGFKVGGALANTTVQSVVGPGPLEITGNAAGANKIRIRCSVLNGGESVVVTLRSSTGVADIGLLSSIPAGSNNIGSVTANAGTNLNTSLLALEAGGNLATIATNTTGVATAANQTTGNTSLSSLVTNTPTKETLTPLISGTGVEKYSYLTGGPPDNTGLPHGPLFSRGVALQGKFKNTGTITSTTGGDTSLTFSVAPKVLQPLQPIRLSGATAEWVFVSSSFTPSASATSIPLQNAVVQAGNTTAAFDSFGDPSATGGLLNNGIGIVALGLYNNGDKLVYPWGPATGDGNNAAIVAMVNNSTYNGSTTDRFRGNLDNITLLASAARTTTQTVADQTNYNARGVVICVDTTVVPGSAPSNVVTINAKDPVSGKYQTLLTSAAITGVSTNFYTVYPGVTPATNVAVSYPLPRTYQVVVTVGNANSATYSIGASYIL